MLDCYWGGKACRENSQPRGCLVLSAPFPPHTHTRSQFFFYPFADWPRVWGSFLSSRGRMFQKAEAEKAVFLQPASWNFPLWVPSTFLATFHNSHHPNCLCSVYSSLLVTSRFFFSLSDAFRMVPSLHQQQQSIKMIQLAFPVFFHSWLTGF